MTTKKDDIDKLVDVERGEIGARIFIDDDIFERELLHLFPRCWLFLAHDTMVPNPGDYMTTFMGTDPVVVVRQKDGSINAFLNFCRHRGMPVCRADSGNTRTFVCSYHGWSYDVTGELVGVPYYSDCYFGELDKSKWGLTKVPRIESYKGLVFGCFDPDAPSLREYLGDMAWYLDGLIDRTPAGIEVLGPPIKWVFRGNWKFAAEQFAGDSYHFETTHISALAGLPPVREVAHAARQESVGRHFSSRLGHGAVFMIGDLTGRMSMTDDPKVFQYLMDEERRASEYLGERGRMSQIGTIFPNFSVHSQASFLRLWHPKGPNAFEAWSWPIAEKAAPLEVKQAIKRFSQLMFSPTGVAEQDDGENWGEIGRNLAAGRLNRRNVLNYQMGLGHTRTDPVYPGTIRDRIFSDIPQLGFYRRWKEFLTSEAWPHVSHVSKDEPRAHGADLVSEKEVAR